MKNLRSDNLNFLVIIQARTGSERLPGKVLLPLGNSNVLKYVIDRCKKINLVSKIIVATSHLKSDDSIERFCQQEGIECYRGSPTDVLSRYVEISRKYRADYIIRVTADCPYLDYELTNLVIKQIQEKNHPIDIVRYIGSIPRGLITEVISWEALNMIGEMNNLKSSHKEHVTYYAYENHSIFKWLSFKVPSSYELQSMRLTLDTIEDYKVLKKISDYYQDETVSSKKAIEYLLLNPKINEINSHIEQKKVE